jgi:hypothetical protein
MSFEGDLLILFYVLNILFIVRIGTITHSTDHFAINKEPKFSLDSVITTKNQPK